MSLLDLLFPAIQAQESMNNPNAVSPKGAFGLMQLMPNTARDPGYGVKSYDFSTPNPSAENQRVGRDYFSALYNKYGGDVPTALMAYNWGPGHVDKWIAGGRQGAVPAETQNYVKKIMANVSPDTAMAPQPSATPQPATNTPPSMLASAGGAGYGPVFPPTVSNVAAKGDMPITTAASAPPATTPTPGATNVAANDTSTDTPPAQSGGLLSRLFGGGGKGLLGLDDGTRQMLMALGAGIAGGSTQGWGAGIGNGLQLASAARMNQQELAMRQAGYELQAKQLENELRHQNVMEAQGQQGLDLAGDKVKERQTELVSSANMVASAAPQYASARKVMTEGDWSPTEFAKAQNVVRTALLGASRITGDKPEELYTAMLPNYGEPKGSAAAKLAAFETYMQGLSGEGGIASTNPVVSKSLENFKLFATPPDTTVPPPADAPAAPHGGAPVQAGVASAPPVPTAVKVKDKQGNPLWYDPATNKRWPRQ